MTHVYGHSHKSQFIVLTCCTARQTRSVPNVALSSPLLNVSRAVWVSSHRRRLDVTLHLGVQNISAKTPLYWGAGGGGLCKGGTVDTGGGSGIDCKSLVWLDREILSLHARCTQGAQVLSLPWCFVCLGSQTNTLHACSVKAPLLAPLIMQHVTSAMPQRSFSTRRVI